MLGHLVLVDGELGQRVGQKLGMEGQAESIEPARQPIAMDPSPALSMVQKAPKTLAGRTVGVLVSNGSDRALVERLAVAVEKEGARLEIVAPKIGGAVAADGKAILADHALAAGPSILFDAVVVAAAGEGIERLLAHPNAIDWVRNAFAHLKVIGYVADAEPLLDRAGVERDEAVVLLARGNGLATFVTAAKAGRVWERERTIEERSESRSRPSRAR
jgi:catalase